MIKRILLLVVLLILFTSCGGSKLKEVTVPAEDYQTQKKPGDTLNIPQAPTPERTLRETEPFEVTISNEKKSPYLRLHWFTIDRTSEEEVVKYQYSANGETRTNKDRLIPFGMSWTLRPDVEKPRIGGKRKDTTTEKDTVRIEPDTTAQAEVGGQPKERKRMAKCPPCPEGWWGLKNEFAFIGALLVSSLIGGGALKLITGSIIPW